MSTVTHNVRLCRAYKTYDEWLDEDPVLLYGEFAFVYNVPGYSNVRLKAGDGYHKFSQLPWHGDPDVLGEGDLDVPNGAVRLDSDGLVPLELIPNELLDKWKEEDE